MMHQTMMSFRRDPDAVKGKHVERALLRRVLRMTRPYKGALVGFFISVIAAAVIGVIPALLFRSLLDNAVPNRDDTLVLVLSALAVLVAFATAGLNLLQRWYASRVGEGLIYDMRVSLFDHVQRLPISFFTRTQTGALQSRLNNDVIGAQNAVTGTLGTVISNIITLVVTLTVMVALEWRLTILTLIVLPAFIIPARRIGRRLQTVTRESFQLDASMNNTIAERFNVSGALVVKLFGNHDRERDYFAQRAGRVRDIGVTSAMYSRVLFVALGFVAAVGTAVVYYVGGELVINGALQIGTIVAFVIYTGQIYAPLTQLTNSRVDVLTALVSFERVFEVLDFPSLLTERPGAVDLVDPAGRIELDHVRFRHPPSTIASLRSLEEGLPGVDDDEPSTWILRDVSLTIEPGELVAIVGPSGAGKTTTAMLVPRIADVVQGAVRVDGHDVRDLTLDSLREAVGFVMQDPHLFHDVDPGEPPVRAAGRDRRRSRRGLPGGSHRRPHPVLAGRIRHRRRRAWLPALRRGEAARRDRPRVAQSPLDRHPRRGHVTPRHRVRARDPTGADGCAGRAHRARDRPPSLDDRQRRPHRGHGRGPDRRRGHARGAAAPGRPLRRPLPHAAGPARRCARARCARVRLTLESRSGTGSIGNSLPRWHVSLLHG